MTPVGRWHPPFLESLRLAWKPVVAYLVFTAIGFLAFFVTLATYERGDKIYEFVVAIGAGLAGVAAGQAVALLRLRTFPVLVVGVLSIVSGGYVVSVARADIPAVVGIALFFFCFAFPSGMLSLHHRFELLGVFWPSVGWIGSVMIILNEEGRVREWERSKATAWLPIPLALLAGFLVGLLLFMAAKQAMRVSLWQALSGATERRLQRKQIAVSAFPRKNLLPLVGVAALLFVFTAVVSPYLWRTGKGDRPSKHGAGEVESDQRGERERRERRGPSFDEEALRRAAQQASDAAKAAAHTLWPLLLLALLYRPLKRAALSTHLVSPVFPTPPSERIENLWEYVRIAAEDAGTAPHAADSIEDFVERARPHATQGAAELEGAARIYARTRYGFVVAPGDSLAMKRLAVPAARGLRAAMSPWARVRSWWRPLS